MRIEQRQWLSETGWQMFSEGVADFNPSLVLVFGAVSLVADPARFKEVRDMYPGARILMSSTAGEIIGATMHEHSLSLTAIEFDSTSLHFAVTDIASPDESRSAGNRLGTELPSDALSHVLIFSDGLKVNGTDLVHGITEKLPSNVAVTGGLVGGGDDFQHTYNGLDEVPREGRIVAIGLYGEKLRVRYGAVGGWDAFGPERMITKANKNVLFELDGRPALQLYKEYLGAKAEGLPGSGLLFPLRLDDGTGHEVVRTILAVNEDEQSITFAGDMPEGVKAQLMKANFERLIGGAASAAEMTAQNDQRLTLAILISCVGRKLVLKDRIEEELEAVQDALGRATVLAGFYSYGEISPAVPTENQCQLHNQTMTITTLSEE